MKHIFEKIALSLSAFTLSCSPALKEPSETPSSPAVFEWTSPLEYEYIDEDCSQLKKYSKIIAQKLIKNEKASPIFKLGNIVFFEIKNSKNTADAVYVFRSAAVALPDHYFEMPNDELFRTFASSVRSQPNALEDYVRVRAMVILSTGNPRYLQEPEDAPTWTERDGRLEIVYYRLKSNGMAAETREKCTLTVDSDQNYHHECQDATAK